MKDKKNLFDINPSEQHDEILFRKVSEQLVVNKRKEKRKILSWILLPATGLAALYLYVRVGKNPLSKEIQADIALFLDMEDAELEIMAELEILEDLDELEEWDESTDA